ncbi:hypothetical protein Kyoto25A_15340 [Helicobacter pylori]
MGVVSALEEEVVVGICSGKALVMVVVTWGGRDALVVSTQEVVVT